MKLNNHYQDKLNKLFLITKKDIKNINTIEEYRRVTLLLTFTIFWALSIGIKNFFDLYNLLNTISNEYWFTFLTVWIPMLCMVWLFYKIISITYYTALELILFSQMQKYFSIRQDLDNTLQKIHLLIREDKASWEIYPKIVNYIQVCSQIIEKNYRKLIFINTNIQRKLQILQKVEKISKMNAYNEYIQHELWEFTQCSEDIIFNLQDWLANHAKELKTLEDTLNENATILNLTKTRIQLQRTNIEKSLLIGNQ